MNWELSIHPWMSKRKRCFVAWEEHIVCAERGNRVVHFYLKDISGNSVLAVVGTERSIRHMTFVATDAFLQAYGHNGLINGFKKWFSRREVVALLASLVSKMETNGSEDNLPSFEVKVPRTVKPQRSEIVWSGAAWFCAKQLKHYPAFCVHGNTIAVHSFISISAEGGVSYVGYLEDMYEDKKEMKKVKVRWFCNNLEDQQVVSQWKPYPNEVLITPYAQVISAKCVVHPVTVLTPHDYERFSTVLSQTSSMRILICYRQFKDDKITPFALTKLRGYLKQAIFSLLYNNSLICKANPQSYDFGMEDEEEFTCDNTLRTSDETVTCGNWKVIRGNGCEDFRGSEPQSQALKSRPTVPGLKFKLLKSMDLKLLPSEPKVYFSSGLNDKIELLCQDSGIQGCWFRCQILRRSEKHLRVKYEDLLDADESGNLEEWVPSVRLAASDKLGIRCPGRCTIRPPPPKDLVNSKFEVGMPVDAWWCEGWWEGVVTGVDLHQSNSLVVYFPGEDKLMGFQRQYLRISRDWVGNRWMDLKPKPEVVTFLAADPCNSIKSSLCSVMASPDGDETLSMHDKVMATWSSEGLSNSSKKNFADDETHSNEDDDTTACFMSARDEDARSMKR